MDLVSIKNKEGKSFSFANGANFLDWWLRGDVTNVPKGTFIGGHIIEMDLLAFQILGLIDGAERIELLKEKISQ